VKVEQVSKYDQKLRFLIVMGQNRNKKITSKLLTLKWNLFSVVHDDVGAMDTLADVYPTVTRKYIKKM
jgi:hypothetical protein